MKYYFITWWTFFFECWCNGILKCIPFTYQKIFFWVQIHFKAQWFKPKHKLSEPANEWLQLHWFLLLKIKISWKRSPGGVHRLTIYMGERAEGASRTVARLLHVVAFGGFVDFRVELLVGAGVTVLTVVDLLAVCRVSPLVTYLDIGAWSWPGGTKLL